MPIQPVNLDPVYPDVVDDGKPHALTHKTDHVAEGQARLIAQYADKPRVIQLLGVYLKQVQDLEDAGWSLVDGFLLDTANDWALDVLGDIVGVKRAGLANGPFRTLVRCAIKANRSNGKPEELIALLTLAAADSPEQPPHVIFRDLVGAVELQLLNNIGPADPNVLFSLLRKATAGGVRLVFAFSPSYYGAGYLTCGSWSGSRSFSAPLRALADAANNGGVTTSVRAG